jgi:hypothetical protein
MEPVVDQRGTPDADQYSAIVGDGAAMEPAMGWSPPLTGWSTTSHSGPDSGHYAAAMGPAAEQQEHDDLPVNPCTALISAMEPAANRRERWPSSSSSRTRGERRNGARRGTAGAPTSGPTSQAGSGCPNGARRSPAGTLGHGAEGDCQHYDAAIEPAANRREHPRSTRR